MATAIKAFHEQVAERLIEQLKQGTAPWQLPWTPGDPELSIPLNPTTGKRYKGINVIYLMAQERMDQRWMTYKQAAAMDAQVRRGEKGTPIQYWKFTEEQTQIDPMGRPILDNNGQPLKKEVRLERPSVFLATVFNAEQIDGLPLIQPKEHAWNAVERAEKILQASGAVIRHGQQNQACYKPTTDSIYLPDKNQFSNAESYYAIALHELGHWTGHSDRLNRDLAHPFGSEGYAKEELRAEISSMILGNELGIGHDPGQHAAYVGSWIKVLQDNPLEIFRAAADAEKIQEYILTFEQKQVQEQTAQQSTRSNQEEITVHQKSRSAVKSAIDIQQVNPQNRQYLAVPYGEHRIAKVAGALWDKTVKSWYVGPQADRAQLERWQPENVSAQQAPAMTPEQEFAAALKSIGCVVIGPHPIMDGHPHRIEVEGDKKGEKAGFYVGHRDGHPAGFIKNNRTGIEMKWRSKGYSFNPEQKAILQEEVAAKQTARGEQQAQNRERAAQRVSQQMADLVPIGAPTPYLKAKGITPQAGIFTDGDGQKTFIPAVDENGKQWTTQYIMEDGTKRFAKGSRKEGCFHIVGGIDAIAAAPALVISEGYATAASMSQALGYGTVAAFDAGNLEPVAKVLHEKYPDKPIIIAGDDDRHLESIQGVNPGKAKALAAAKAVDGKAIFPVFAPNEATYPKDLPPVTPRAYRKHLSVLKASENENMQKEKMPKGDQLSAEQLAALNTMKRYTDFNDLATKSILGVDGLERQVKAAVTHFINKSQTREVLKIRQQEPLLVQKQGRRPRTARL